MANLGSLRPAAGSQTVWRGKPVSITDEVLVGLLGTVDFVTAFSLTLIADYTYHRVVMGFTAMSHDAVTVASVLAALIVVFQYISGAYALREYIATKGSIRSVLVHWVMIFFIVAWIGFLFKITAEFSRASLSVTFVVGAAGLVTTRMVVASMLERGIERGAFALRTAYMICLGEVENHDKIIQETTSNGVRVVGSYSVRPNALSTHIFADTCDTIVEDVRAAFDRLGFSEIYVFFPWDRWRALGTLRSVLAQLPLPVFLFADNEVRRVVSGSPIEIGFLRGFEIQRAPLSSIERLSKRCLDLFVASAALALLSPLIAATSLGILLETGRPVLFRQWRRGFGDRPFAILKFRTMHCMDNGEQIVQATRSDNRVTRLGAILRRTSVDELPQLINVLRGEMSIVGPRPHALAHDNQYDKLIAAYAFRRHVKPGLTGWAQVHGLRGETRELGKMEGRVNHDLWYINNWSIWLDLWIMARTLRALLFDRNAY